MNINQPLTSVAQQLAEILTSRQGKLLGREFLVSEDCGGDVHITPSKVILHPLHITVGNPVVAVTEALKLAEKYDRERERSARVILDTLRHQLRCAVRQLATLDPESITTILNEELGPDSREALILELED